MDMNDPSITTSGGYCYHYSYNKSKGIFGYDSHDPKYYDQIITKLNLQAREQYESSSMQRLLQDQTTRSSRNKKIRVLLVDDEPDICMVYQIVLEDAGYECISYTDSVKALQEFRPTYYDLILLDIKMPVLTLHVSN
jgi:PleD family two-component response regulator